MGYPLPLDSYPIFDEAHRDILNGKIERRFWFREIGVETPEMFNFYLNRTMLEIMPYYNQLYKTTLQEYDPLATMDYKEILNLESDSSETGTSTASGTSSSDSGSKSRTVNSDTPQSMLAGNGDYASSGTDAISDTTANGTTGSNTNENRSGKATETGDRHIVGSQGPVGELLRSFRRSMINVDLMVLSELEPLFMQLWHNGDSEANDGLFSYYMTNFLGW